MSSVLTQLSVVDPWGAPPPPMGPNSFVFTCQNELVPPPNGKYWARHWL